MRLILVTVGMPVVVLVVRPWVCCLLSQGSRRVEFGDFDFDFDFDFDLDFDFRSCCFVFVFVDVWYYDVTNAGRERDAPRLPIGQE